MALGVLSALPVIYFANICCCLWVVSGGVLAAYLLQQNEAAPLQPADGALVGLLAGVIGAFVYLVLSIPINILLGPIERQILQRLVETTGTTMPPEFRDYVGSVVSGVVGGLIGFIFYLFVGSIFSTLGGLLGAALFRKPPQSSTIDVPTT